MSDMPEGDPEVPSDAAWDEAAERLLAEEGGTTESVPTPDPADQSGQANPSGQADPDLNVEDLVASLETVSAERDQYLDSLRRVQAEFENYKKAVAKRNADDRERANDKIVGDLLPVLDACDGAVSNGSDDVVPVRTQLLAALERHGLERTDPADAAFNPEEHEAVMHEPADDVAEPTVAEVLRPGYLWKGRVLRPAMVKVKG